MKTFDADKCDARLRIAARRDDVTAFPLSFLRQPTQAEAKILEESLREQFGEDLYIHYMEAANDNYIEDRFMFLGDSTLKNIAAEANSGFAFMNSHRTGGLSSPAELPMGHSFFGRYENFSYTVPSVLEDGVEEKRKRKRAYIGVYMKPGLAPNGANGPTTDDLHQMILTKTVSDVSVGLYDGWNQCDLCGNDLNAFDEDGKWLCPHYPGTSHKMTKEEIAAQKERGVKSGTASYTYQDGHCGETSAVYDGAVPGAGFIKTLNAFKRGELPSHNCAEARVAYVRLVKRGEFETMDENRLTAFMKEQFDSLRSVFSHKPETLSEKSVEDDRVALALKAIEEERQKFQEERARSLVRLAMTSGRLHKRQEEAATKLALASPDDFQTFLDTCDVIPDLHRPGLLSTTLDESLKGRGEEELEEFRAQVRKTLKPLMGNGARGGTN